MPTQLESGRSTRFCGAALDVENFTDHVYAAHMSRGRITGVKFVDPEKAARRLMEHARAFEQVPGRARLHRGD